MVHAFIVVCFGLIIIFFVKVNYILIVPAIHIFLETLRKAIQKKRGLVMVFFRKVSEPPIPFFSKIKEPTFDFWSPKRGKTKHPKNTRNGHI